jgi:hypothetical protein
MKSFDVQFKEDEKEKNGRQKKKKKARVPNERSVHHALGW